MPTICGHFDRATGVRIFPGAACDSGNYCGEFIRSGVHAGQIAVSIVEANCDDIYYGCIDRATGKFSVTIPDDCCKLPCPSTSSSRLHLIFSGLEICHTGEGACFLLPPLEYYLCKEIYGFLTCISCAVSNCIGTWGAIIHNAFPTNPGWCCFILDYFPCPCDEYPPPYEVCSVGAFVHRSGNSIRILMGLLYVGVNNCCHYQANYWYLDEIYFDSGTVECTGGIYPNAIHCPVDTGIGEGQVTIIEEEIPPVWIIFYSYVNGDNVVGTSGEYSCMLAHISTEDNKPSTGANWATYWKITECP